jgi:hypothetical protein
MQRGIGGKLIATRFFRALRPGWIRLGLSVFPAYVLGWVAGPLLYDFSHYWIGPGYSRIAIGLAYLVSWPIFLLGTLLEKYAHAYLNFGNLNPFAPEFVLLWLYYYVLVTAADYVATKRNRGSFSTP